MLGHEVLGLHVERSDELEDTASYAHCRVPLTCCCWLVAAAAADCANMREVMDGVRLGWLGGLMASLDVEAGRSEVLMERGARLGGAGGERTLSHCGRTRTNKSTSLRYCERQQVEKIFYCIVARCQCFRS